jgi:hypothetical protein
LGSELSEVLTNEALQAMDSIEYVAANTVWCLDF